MVHSYQSYSLYEEILLLPSGSIVLFIKVLDNCAEVIEPYTIVSHNPTLRFVWESHTVIRITYGNLQLSMVEVNMGLYGQLIRQLYILADVKMCFVKLKFHYPVWEDSVLTQYNLSR